MELPPETSVLGGRESGHAGTATSSDRGLFRRELRGAASAAPLPPEPSARSEAPGFRQTGTASWYGADHQGQKTANGERFDTRGLTAAHRDLPFNTIARVTNVRTGRSVKVRINDRGPIEKGRIIDLSSAAATALGIGDKGVTTVLVEVFGSDQPLAR